MEHWLVFLQIDRGSSSHWQQCGNTCSDWKKWYVRFNHISTEEQCKTYPQIRCTTDNLVLQCLAASLDIMSIKFTQCTASRAILTLHGVYIMRIHFSMPSVSFSKYTLLHNIYEDSITAKIVYRLNPVEAKSLPSHLIPKETSRRVYFGKRVNCLSPRQGGMKSRHWMEVVVNYTPRSL
jgi:hypothetical protein